MPPIPLDDASFNLNSSGVAGFFGGEEAVSAMGTVHFHRGQKWLGWYNSPGSYTVAKQYGKLANNRFWDGLFPGPDIDPAELFELTGQKGPEFISWVSGTRLKHTEHMTHIFAKAVRKLQAIEIKPKDKDRGTRTSFVTVVDLKGVEDFTPNMLQRTSFSAACLTMLASIAPCVACGVFGDWYCFAMIILGVIANAFSCYVIGSGKLDFKRPKPSQNSPLGHGILKHDAEVIILRGKEDAVAAVTSGYFALTYSGGDERTVVGLCSLFQYAQFLAQLLLIPQGKLFGQIMFLATFVASWIYNCYLSSKDKDKLQYELMMKILNKPDIKRFKLQTRTTMVVFALLALKPVNPMEFLDELLPKGTPTWTAWRKSVLERLRQRSKPGISNSDNSNPDATEDDALLADLLGDAEIAYDEYDKNFPDEDTGEDKV